MIRLLPVAPNGFGKAYGFACGPAAPSGIVEFTVNDYPQTAEAKAFGDLRDREPVLGFRATARLLGIKPSEVSSLQRGSAVPADGWDAVWAALGRRP